MADLAYRNDLTTHSGERTNWGAIWAGVFAFAAIWSVFGMLGEAIFASSANPNVAKPVGGMSVGLGVWATILTIIAMYVAGRVTGHFARPHDRNGRIMHGLAMFGLSVIGVVVLLILSGTAISGGTGVPGGPHSSYMLTVFSDVGWIGFASLFLGWLAAMGGAAHSAVNRATGTGTGATTNVRDIRPAA